MRAEHALEECSRHFIVLRVRGRGLDRESAVRERGDECSVIARALFAQAKCADRANAGPEQGLGDETGIDELLDEHAAAYITSYCRGRREV